MLNVLHRIGRQTIAARVQSGELGQMPDFRQTPRSLLQVEGLPPVAPHGVDASRHARTEGGILHVVRGPLPPLQGLFNLCDGLLVALLAHMDGLGQSQASRRLVTGEAGIGQA